MAMIVVIALTMMPLASNAEVSEADAKEYGTVIGIDLGTTYSCVAYVVLFSFFLPPHVALSDR